jgi:diguanylate cyclase (GGDEF)-like protein
MTPRRRTGFGHAPEENDVIGRVIRSKAMARAAVIGLTLGMFALATLAVFSSSSTAQTTGDVRRANTVSDEWGRLVLNVGIENEALNDYLRADSAVGRQPLLSAIGSADTNLAWLSEHGEPADAEHAAEVADVYGGYTGTLRDLVEASNRGDRDSVDTLAQQAGLGASMLRKAASSNVVRKRLEMNENLSGVDKRNQQLRLAAGVIFGVDFMLLTLCGMVLFTHQRRVERQAIESRHQALHDGLTGLPNRVLLADRIEQGMLMADRHGEAVGLLLLDLDRFKEVNDTLGHHAGDLLLQEAASRLSGAVRDYDTVARLGGDEFAVVLPRVGSAEHCMEVAGRLLEALEGPADLDGVLVDISGSIGAAVFPADSANPTELLQHADIAMYTAKRGRLGTALYDAEADKHSSEQLGLMGELRRAIDGGELVLHYQPKMQTDTSRVVGVEALCRWQHPIRGLLPPAEFIPQAEDSDLILPLTDAVLDLALQQQREWRNGGTLLPVAVNIATRCLHDLTFPDRVAALLGRHDVAADALTLEITESALITDPARASSVLRRLRDLGVRLSIDDFGTGYSSMAYLQSMPLTELKIDRRFINAVYRSPGNLAIVRAILDLAHALGLEVVAEGVEDEATLAALETMGCDIAQGYHMCRPIAAPDLIAWVGRHQPLDHQPLDVTAA